MYVTLKERMRNMKSSKEQLSSVLKTTQMGQVGIRGVMPYVTNEQLKEALISQLQEYDMLEKEAHKIAAQQGWELPELQTVAKMMSNAYSRANLMFGNVNSRIAAMMITGNTKGLIKSTKNMHHGTDDNQQIRQLTKKLLAYEEANIRQMQAYL